MQLHNRLLSRRSLITGLVSFVAAPAIVRASSLMPVHDVAHLLWPTIGPNYAELTAITRTALVPRLFVQICLSEHSISEAYKKMDANMREFYFSDSRSAR